MGRPERTVLSGVRVGRGWGGGGDGREAWRRGAGETLLRKGVDVGKGVPEMGSLAGNWALGGERWELGTGDRANLNPGKREGKGCQAKGVNAGLEKSDVEVLGLAAARVCRVWG